MIVPEPGLPLVLASRSASRCAMLDAAGVHYIADPADIDETALTSKICDDVGPKMVPSYLAMSLARAKAVAVSARHPGHLVLGVDSLAFLTPDSDLPPSETVPVGLARFGQMFDKPRTREEALAHLQAFSLRNLSIVSGAALAIDGTASFIGSDEALLHFRHLSPSFIDQYLDDEWPAIAGCVGCFRIEGRGVQLFSAVHGDYFTILGMPLFIVLQSLRAYGHVPT